MIRPFIWLSLAAAIAAGSALAAETVWNWGRDTETSGYDASKAVCRRLGPPVIPASDRPSPADAAQLRDCDAEALYYGFGAAPDYVKARQCAVLHLQNEAFFSGEAILMQIYANGRGVTRNLDLATAFACTIESAPAENDARVLHLQAMKTEAAPKPFDICDDITSGFAGGACAARDATLKDAVRDRQIANVATRFPAASQPSLTRLKAALDAFADAHSRGEVDLGGTARDAFIVQAETLERDQFLQDLTRLAKGTWPKASSAQAVAEDTQLNTSYKNAMACVAGKNNLSTLKADDVRTAQRAWMAYRDAWVNFAAAAAPQVPRDAMLARLTKLRRLQLQKLPCG